MKNLCENVLSEERFQSLYPPPADTIAQKAQVRAQFKNAVKLLAVSARNQVNASSSSDELRDITSWTLEDVERGELSTDQLMHLAKLRFNGGSSSSDKDIQQEQKQEQSDTQSGTQRDPELAVAAWIQASKRGNTDASYSVAFCLLNGIGLEQDEEQAFRLMDPLANSYNNAHAHVSERERRGKWLCDWLPVCELIYSLICYTMLC
jgi:TPR repeat protein